jgi:restriction endonuclease Mrr
MENEKLEPQDVLSEIRSIKPESFEYFISDLWEYIGYNTNVTKHSSDKGIDIVASREFPYNERILIQAKRYGSESTISGPEMQKYGRLSGKEDIDTVLIISTGGFTKQAEEIADEDNLKCIGGKIFV